MESIRAKPYSVSISQTQALPETSMDRGDKFAVQIEVGGNLIGTFKLQAKQKGATNWVDIDDTEQSVSGPADAVIVASNINFDLIREYFTRTSGTGDCVFHRTVKG